ncbi:MAG: FtsX-like permease family protein [Myxococcota bacterium]
MTLWQLIVRQVRQRGLSSTLTALSVALGVMLVTSILLLQHQMEEHFLKPGRGYQVVVGAPGSALQLTLNAVYHMDKSPGLMPMRWWPELEENDSVALAVPYAVGDSFRGYRVVATTDALFDRRFPHPEGEGQEKLAAGRPFHFDREGLYRRLRGLGAGGFEATQPDVPELASLTLNVAADGTATIGEASAETNTIEAAAREAEAQRAILQVAPEAPVEALTPLIAPLRAAGVTSVRVAADPSSDAPPNLTLHLSDDGLRYFGDNLDDAALREELSRLEGDARVSVLAPQDVAAEALARTLTVLRGEEVAEIVMHIGRAAATPVEATVVDAPSQNFEAVVGAQVAEELGVRVGDEIEPTHGVEGGVVHDHVHLWNVVGILEKTGTPVDRVVFINLDSFFAIEEHMDGALIPGTNEAGLSSILLFPRPGVHKAVLLSSLNREPEVSVADVSEQIRNLFSIVGSVDTIFLLVSIMVVILGVLSILVAIYNTMSERRREVAILRAIGARRTTVFGTIVGEAALLTLLGAAAGLGLGHLLVYLSASRVEEAAGFLPDAATFLPIELGVAAVVVVGGALAGLVPAWKAYRTDVAANLKPLS